MGLIVLLLMWQGLELKFEWKLEKDKLEFPRHKVCSRWQIQQSSQMIYIPWLSFEQN